MFYDGAPGVALKVPRRTIDEGLDDILQELRNEVENEETEEEQHLNQQQDDVPEELGGPSMVTVLTNVFLNPM